MAQTDQKSSLNTYLGTAPSERVGDLIVERFTKWRNTLSASGQYTQWQRNFSQHHGGPADAESTEDWNDGYSLDGDNSEILSIRINEMRNLITHILNLTYSKPVGARAIAQNGESGSLQAAAVADALLEEDFRCAEGTKIMRRAGEGALVVSTSFVMVDWDFSAGEEYVPTAPAPEDVLGPDGQPQPPQEVLMTGRPRITDFWIDQVCFDSTKRDWRDVYDVILLRRYNKFELASRAPPEHLDKILNANPVNKSSFTSLQRGDDDSSDIVVFEYIHRKVNGRFLPDGRRVLCLEDGTVLDDGPNPCADMNELNIYPVTAAQGLGSVYGYAVANDLSPLNRIVNLLATILATNMAAHGSPNLTGPKLQMVDIQNLMGGAKYFGVSQGQEVKAMNLLPDMKPVVELMGTFSQYGEKLSGLAGVMRGDDTGDMSGKAIALVKSMAVQFMSSFQQSVVEQHEKIFNALIWLRKNFSTGPQKVAKLGGENIQEVIEYDAQQTLGQIARVRAEPIDPVMATPEGREQRANAILQMGGFEHPWEYITMVKTGRDDTLFKGPMSRNLLMQRENAKLLRGEMPLALQEDDHQKHKATHLILLDDPAVRENDPILQGVQEHNAVHTMYEMGLTPMQGNDPQTGQPYPSARVQLAQAQAMAQQQQQTMPAPQQGAPEQGGGGGQQSSQPPPRASTPGEWRAKGAMEPQPN